MNASPNTVDITSLNSVLVGSATYVGSQHLGCLYGFPKLRVTSGDWLSVYKSPTSAIGDFTCPVYTGDGIIGALRITWGTDIKFIPLKSSYDSGDGVAQFSLFYKI